jgi:putative phosphoribosyl transferase
MMQFRNRIEAGQALAKKLMGYAHRKDVLVLALPRGGVPVAFEVAAALQAPLDVFIVRKLGVPGHEELAMGAIASGGVRVLNHEIRNYLRIREAEIEAIGAREKKELERRERLYRDDRQSPDVHGRTVILVDDGLATGATMRAAVMALSLRQPARIIVAVPVAPRFVCEEFLQEADECVCVLQPTILDGVGRWYADFTQTTDQEVQILLRQASSIHQPGLGETPAV